MTDVAATTTRGGTVSTAQPSQPSPAQQVQQTAARAAESVLGVHELGIPAGRALVRAMGRVPGGRTTYGRGVSVEVGERQAAVDVSLVVEFGSPAPAVADQVRGAVREQVRRESGLEVIEVNVTVVGLHHPDDDVAPELVVEPAGPGSEPVAEPLAAVDPDADTEEVREAGDEVRRVVARAVEDGDQEAVDGAPERVAAPTVVVGSGSGTGVGAGGPGPDVVVADQVVLADSVVVVDGEPDQHDDQHEDQQAPPRRG